MSGITIEKLAQFFERGEPEDLQNFGGIEGLANEFRTSLKEGISATEASSNYKERKEKWGINVLPDPPSKTWCRLFFGYF